MIVWTVSIRSMHCVSSGEDRVLAYQKTAATRSAQRAPAGYRFDQADKPRVRAFLASVRS